MVFFQKKTNFQKKLLQYACKRISEDPGYFSSYGLFSECLLGPRLRTPIIFTGGPRDGPAFGDVVDN